jgi:hypothetical protein
VLAKSLRKLRNRHAERQKLQSAQSRGSAPASAPRFWQPRRLARRDGARRERSLAVFLASSGRALICSLKASRLSLARASANLFAAAMNSATTLFWSGA